jgi:uncharacterized protein YndB with AHSA1/START domain
MTVISSEKDPEQLTMVMVAEFEAGPDRVWQVLEDPRKLERWWGPPGYPATFTRFEFAPGGQCRYYMTGPEGRGNGGWWRIDAIEPQRWLRFANGLAGPDGEPAPDMEPVIGEITLEATANGTRMTAFNQFADTAQMELLIGMGMDVGMKLAIGQIDALLGTPVAS